MEEVLEDVVAAKRLRWAGHVARMDVCLLPKTLLFSWLPQKRPAHGTKLRWRDKVRKDLKHLGIEESSWYKEAQDRGHWRAMCKEGLATCTEERQRKGRAYGRGPPSTSEFTAPVLVCPTCSEGGRTSQDTSARQLVHVDLVLARPMLSDLSLPLRGRRASPLRWLSFKVQGSRCVCVCVCYHSSSYSVRFSLQPTASTELF